MLMNEKEIQAVRKMLQSFNEGLGTYINEDRRHKLGKVLTIIDASIGDVEQRKAIKDLINDSWWNVSAGSLSKYSIESPSMINPHTDLRAICSVLGFELYPKNPQSMPAGSDADDITESYAKKRYNKLFAEADNE